MPNMALRGARQQFATALTGFIALAGLAMAGYGIYAWYGVRADQYADLDNFARLAARSATLFYDRFDSALGVLGAVNGSTRQIKDFGGMIIREHHALSKDVSDLAKELGLQPIMPSTAPDAPSEAMRTTLANTQPGSAHWDKLYAQYAAAAHEAALENTARALAATKRPEIKRFIKSSVPILQKHLDKAKSLAK